MYHDESPVARPESTFRRARSFATLLTGIAVVSVASSSAHAQNPKAPRDASTSADASNVDEARSHYDKGMQFFSEENYDAALVEMERAYQIAPSYRILYNLGSIQKGRNNYAAALRDFQEYLKQGGGGVPAERRADVEKEVASLKSRVATVEVRVNLPGADVAIDDVVVGKSPLQASAVVNPGRRRITASKSGLAPVTKLVSLAAADAEVVTIDLVSAGTRVVIKESDPKWRNRAIGMWSTTGVLLGAATVTGIFALRASSDLKDARAVAGVSSDDLSSAGSRSRNLGIATDILGGLAIVGAGIATFFTVKAVRANRAVTTGLAPSPALDVGVGLGGFRVSSAF